MKRDEVGRQDVATRKPEELEFLFTRALTLSQKATIAALDALSTTGLIVRSGTASFLVRTLTGTAGEIDVADGDGIASAPVFSLPTLIVGQRQIGKDASHKVEFENNTGFLRFDGNARAWDDIQFQVSSGKVGAANFPTWEVFTANTAEYSFAVNDYIDLGANEPSHGWAEGTEISVHLHLAPKVANSTGADRFAKFEVNLGYADVNEVWTEVAALTAELTIPNGSPAIKHYLLSMGNLSLPNNLIGTQIKPRVKRIAATGGTEYASNVFITQLGGHQILDAMGSRSVATK